MPHTPAAFDRCTSRALLGFAIAVASSVLIGSAPSRVAAHDHIQRANAPSGSSDGGLRDFVANYCTDCHDAATREAELDLTSIRLELEDSANFARWQAIYDRVQNGEMPPADADTPWPAERDAVAAWLAERLTVADRARQAAEGRTVIRRLNRVQVENTLRDLLALPHLKIKALLPEDGVSHGFNTVGEALDVSSVHMARYLEAARHAVEQATNHLPNAPPARKTRLDYTQEGRLDPPQYPFLAVDGKGVMFSREFIIFKTVLTKFPAPFAGDYRIRIKAQGYQTAERMPLAVVAGQGVARSRITDTHLLSYFDVPPDRAEEIELVGWLERSDYVRVFPPTLPEIRFPRDRSSRVKHNYRGPGLAIDWVEIEGPIIEVWPPESHRRLYGDLPLVRQAIDRAPQRVGEARKRGRGPSVAAKQADDYRVSSDAPMQDARRLLAAFLPRAFRRPATEDEVALYASLVNTWLARGADFEEALQIGYAAALSSPEFLYFQEQPGKLDDYALASRLSYFLWNSMPDDELFGLAARGELRRPDTLRAQVERMLADGKAERFVSDFVGQWLDTYQIEFTTPDGDLYPEYDKLLEHSMVRETELFFTELLNENLSVANFIDSKFSILNCRLAEHYGIGGVEGVEMRRVELPDGCHRGGVMSHASVLKVTANGTTTSPVLRGVWMLTNLLDQPPPPPPPAIPGIEPDTRGAATIREQLAKHREMASCAACHERFDPLGFALESYDVVGAWRQRYRTLELGEQVRRPLGLGHTRYFLGHAVATADRLRDGRAFADIDELKQLLLVDRRQIARSVASKLLTYATGAPPSFADRELIEQIVSRTERADFGLRSIVHEVVASQAFLNK